MTRGWFAIGTHNPKHDCNVASLFRSAYCFGADYIYTVGRKYQRGSPDTPNASNHLPCFHYLRFEDLLESVPLGGRLVCIENSPGAFSLDNFVHPQRAIYLLGSETNGLPPEILKGRIVVSIPTVMCLNVAVTGAIVMFDRQAKGRKCSLYGSIPITRSCTAQLTMTSLPGESLNVDIPAGH